MEDAPWLKEHGLPAVTARWRKEALGHNVVDWRSIPARCSKEGQWPASLDLRIIEALKRRGVAQPFSHQEQAIRAALDKRHVVIATPTASGKSLCFHVPVVQAMLEEPSATALFLYPTKALSRDQEQSLLDLLQETATSDVGAVVFDGDTPADARQQARERARIILTNPDMLHSGILPNHAKWVRIFSNLKYVVIDELHTYRGVFGSHMAHVLTRLRRIANFHGSDPIFISATATIGNPREHAARLIGVPPSRLELIGESGAPSAPREVLIYNPPYANESLGIRQSALKHAVSMAAQLIRAKVPTLVFAPSRNSVELLLKYLRVELAGDIDSRALMAYRGGYLPNKRRAIEAGLRNGEILGVVSTSALELGIDIGDLEAVVCLGFPGSIAATWQRFGRAGRRGATSLALLVCSSEPLDQYFAGNPEALGRAQSEEARIDPHNVEIVLQHLKCAAFEAPFEMIAPGAHLASPEEAVGEDYAQLGMEHTRNALEYLMEQGQIHERGDRYYYTGDPFPASNVSLRTIGWDNFVIIDVENEKTLAELDWRATHTMLHEQAIYQHDAEQYQVEKLDFENHKAYVRRVQPDYFTTALTYRMVEILESEEESHSGALLAGLGEVKVIEKVTGYKKIKYFSHENAGFGDVHLPEMEMMTSAFWLTIPEIAMARLGGDRAAVTAALHSAGQALETVSTLALMCEPSDINRTMGDGENREAGLPPGRNPFAGRVGHLNPTIFLFDAYPGGVGLAPRIFKRRQELCALAAQLIQRCPCEKGCPACIGPGALAGQKTKDLAKELLSMAARS